MIVSQASISSQFSGGNPFIDILRIENAVNEATFKSVAVVKLFPNWILNIPNCISQIFSGSSRWAQQAQRIIDGYYKASAQTI